MTELITSGTNADFPALDMAHKDFREAWLEGVIRQAKVDLDYIGSCLDVAVANRRKARLHYELDAAIKKIDEADAKRKLAWEAKRQAALTRAQEPLLRRLAHSSSRLLPPVTGLAGDDRPLFLQGAPRR